WHVRPGAPDEMVAAHRSSWKPSTLPFLVPLSSDAESGYDQPTHERVMATPPFRDDLCLVAVDEQDAPVGSCIAWLDESTGIANVEPLGVVPTHRRLGVAGALLDHVGREVARLGGATVVIQPRGDAAYPAPRGAYAKAGFDAVDRTWAMRR
ncbi:MAG TPA: GNAT family N-acetyltransferase, partial [Acidimicrobiales bacterium]|nr:GNAT family N-acetyltransferase [Acidimicrobiales bacterium]